MFENSYKQVKYFLYFYKIALKKENNTDLSDIKLYKVFPQ